jgi:hypothetical protein
MLLTEQNTGATPMPRYSGKALGLTHPVRTLLDKDTFKDVKACQEARGENQAEFVRQAILFFLLTKCSQDPIDSTMQPSDEGVQP